MGQGDEVRGNKIEVRRGFRKYTPHSIIAGSGTGAEDDGKLRHIGTGDSRDELGAMLGNTTFFRVGADHEAANVLQKDEWDLALRAELNEVCTLQGRF